MRGGTESLQGSYRMGGRAKLAEYLRASPFDNEFPMRPLSAWSISLAITFKHLYTNQPGIRGVRAIPQPAYVSQMFKYDNYVMLSVSEFILNLKLCE